MDCKFCLTALMGLERNLTAGEIVGQVLHVMRENGLKATNSRLNVVMMGMGEPLLNLGRGLKGDTAAMRPRRHCDLPAAHYGLHLRNRAEDGGTGPRSGPTQGWPSR